MHHQHLDRIAKILGTEIGSRRRLFRTLAGGVLAAGLGQLGREGAGAAGCQTVGRRCDKSGDCCAGARCRKGKCRCKPGRPKCGKVCCLAGASCQLFPVPPYNPICVNGPYQPGDACDPAKPGVCTSGICSCASGNCTCREVLCRPKGAVCSATYQCCEGFCNPSSFLCDT